MSTTTDELLEQFTELIPQLQVSPYTRDLHLQHILITKTLGLVEELEQARSMLESYFPLTEGSSSSRGQQRTQS